MSIGRYTRKAVSAAKDPVGTVKAVGTKAVKYAPLPPLQVARQGYKLTKPPKFDDGNAYDGGGDYGDYWGHAAEAMEAQHQYGVAMVEKMFEMEELATQRHLDRVPEYGDLARGEAAKAGDFINERMRADFYAVLDDLVPEWRETILGAGTDAVGDATAITKAFKENVLPEAMRRADEISFQMLDTVQAQLRGEINPDVADQLKRQAAEISQQIGVRGQAAQHLTARDLGLTSMDIQQQGMQNAPAAMQFAPAAYEMFGAVTQAPMNAAGNLTNILAAYRSPTTDWQNLWGANLGLATQGAVMPGGTAFQGTAQAMQYAGQNYNTAQNTFMQAGMQQQANAMAMQMHQDNLKMQGKANQMNFFSSLIGAGMEAGAKAMVG